MGKTNRIALRRVLGVGLILCHVVSSAHGQTGGQSVTVNLRGKVAEQHTVGNYVIRLRATLGELGTQGVPNRLEIFRAGELVHYQVGSYLSIGCTEAEIPVGARLKVGQDVTGAGHPELVIKDEQFNSSGTSDWYVFSLDKLGFGLHASVLYVITGEDKCPFRDLDGDGVPEFIVLDPAFTGFHSSHAETPYPTVVLKLNDGSYEPAPELMRTPVPGTGALTRKAQSLRTSPAWGSDEPPAELGQSLVDLIYGGHSAEAKAFLREAWPEGKSGMREYWLELRDLLSKSRYWSQRRVL